MRGEQVKNILIDKGYKLSHVAKKLNISPQDMHSKLKALDIKTGFLEDIMKAINKSIYFFYQTKMDSLSSPIVFEPSENFNTNSLTREIIKKDKEIDQLERIIKDKEEIIKSLQGKNNA